MDFYLPATMGLGGCLFLGIRGSAGGAEDLEYEAPTFVVG